MKNMRRGFTLIELLIVVAIIGILATIAVPNFVNTWNRAKISRAKADLKALATALDMYRLDHGNYPYVQDKGGVEWQMPAGFPANHDKGPAGLTSPIPYLSNALPDPFLLELGKEGNAGNYLLYYERCGFGFNATGDFIEIAAVNVPVDANGTLDGVGKDQNVTDPKLVPAEYIVYSVGPDRHHRIVDPEGNVIFRSRFNRHNRYDPSNGLFSQGNILRLPGGRYFPE